MKVYNRFLSDMKRETLEDRDSCYGKRDRAWSYFYSYFISQENLKLETKKLTRGKGHSGTLIPPTEAIISIGIRIGASKIKD